MRGITYIGKMLLLSLILTIIVNVVLLGFRYFPFNIFTDWAWRFPVGDAVVIIPWFAMVTLSLFFTLIIRLIGRNK